MKRSCLLFIMFIVAGLGSVRADQTTAAVQEALKDQGFYYGTISGEKNADTTAAIRRYQIRNGLQITGEIDAETLRSLGVGSGREPSKQPPSAAAPSDEEPAENDTPSQSAELPPARYPTSPPPAGISGAGPAFNEPRSPVTGVFAGTPYEMAPPDVQRHVILGAQARLARFGLYRSGIDGEFGPGTATAVRGFQARSGLFPDGRLNMPTLAALGLLPGQHGPSLRPRRVLPRPVYRGEYVPER